MLNGSLPNAFHAHPRMRTSGVTGLDRDTYLLSEDPSGSNRAAALQSAAHTTFTF
jgi:hypothetical protein